MICRNFMLQQVLVVVVPGGTLPCGLTCVMENLTWLEIWRIILLPGLAFGGPITEVWCRGWFY